MLKMLFDRRCVLAWLFLGIVFLCRPLFAETPLPGALAPTEPAQKEIEASNITLDFKEADINTVLRVMSLKSKVNIVAGPEVQGTVTIRLENVPWEKALQVVLRTYGYVYERDGNIIRVTTRENLAAEPVVTQTFILNYTKATEVQLAVQDILTERGRIKTADRTNTLIITDIPTNLYTISEVLKKLDRPTPEAYVDSKIVSTTLGRSENLGIQWQTGGGENNLGSLIGSGRPVTFPFPDGRKEGTSFYEAFLPRVADAQVNNPENPKGFPTIGDSAVTSNSETAPAFSYGTLSFTGFSAILQMLKSRANTKIVSNPRIVVLNNQTASIHVGDNIPLPTFDTNSTTGRLVVSGFNYDTLRTGVTMDVTPHINSNDEILVDLQPSVNARGATIQFNADLSAPIINETTARTQVLIESGQTIAIGGLLTDNMQLDEAEVPYFADIPLVGKLFRSKRQTAGSGNAKVETLFFVTVTIVDSEGQPVETQRQKDRRNKKSAKDKKSGASSTELSTDPKVEKNETPAVTADTTEAPTGAPNTTEPVAA